MLEIVERILIQHGVIRKYKSLKQASFNYFLY